MKTPTRAARILAFSIAWLTVHSAFGFYNPQVGRWVNRDPIQEQTGVIRKQKLQLQAKEGWNLYTFCRHDAVNRVDKDGKGWFSHLISEAMSYVGLGGLCCNHSPNFEMWLDNGKWNPLPPGKCTQFFDDCDGFTCGDSYQRISTGNAGSCDGNCNIGTSGYTPANPPEPIRAPER